MNAVRRLSSSSQQGVPARRRCTAIRRQLLRWYDRHRRDLPWRRQQSNPYAQWIAEIMLQQTRVETVVDYYKRFLRLFPSVDALARAKRDQVLKQWEGLGYYRRAVHLHEAARQVVRSGGKMPVDADGLRTLAGVGEYTAAAIASIAYGEPVAAVDGNVARVIARLFDIRVAIMTSPGKKQVAAIARALLARKRPGDFNQAWMDLGSAICTPRTPSCHRCPLASHCQVAGLDRAGELPRRNVGAARHKAKVEIVVGLFRLADKQLVRKRPEGGLWSGLWEFPNVEIEGRSNKYRTLHTLATSEGLAVAAEVASIGKVRHELTHRTMVFHLFDAPVEADRKSLLAGRRWATNRSIEKLGMSTACRRIIEKALLVRGR